MTDFTERLQIALRALISCAGTSDVVATIRLWQTLAAALVPVVGEDGFHSLFARSVHLSSTGYPWLALRQAGSGWRDRFAGLETTLTGMPPAEASQASILMLMHFIETLTLVIGEPLMINVLHSAWGKAFIFPR